MKKNTTCQPDGALSRYALAFAAAAAGLLPLGAAPIAIPNPGFENRIHADGIDKVNTPDNGPTNDIWRQLWVTINGGPLYTWNPGADGALFEGSYGYGFGGTAPGGQNVQIVRSAFSLTSDQPVLSGPGPRWDGLNYFEAACVLLDGTIGSPAVPSASFDPTKIYKLTAKVGKPPIFVTNNVNQFASDPRRPATAVWHGYALQLAAGGTNVSGSGNSDRVEGGTIVSQDSNSRAVPVDEFRPVTTTYFPNPADSALNGQKLQIRLAAIDNPADFSMTGHVAFDDVTLDEFAAPALAYWDLNDTTAGAGGPAPTGTWDGTNQWNAVADGTGVTGPWTPGQTAVFSAGGDATDPYTVTVSGTQSIGGLSFKDGTVTLSGGTALELAGIGMIDVASGLTATVATPLTEASAGLEIAKTGTGTLVLSGSNIYSGGTTVLDGTLRLGASDVLADTSVVSVTGRSTGTAAFDLNGNSDTVGGLILGGSAVDSAAAVSTGAGTLTLAGDVSYVNAAGNGANPQGATISGNLNLGAAARAFLVNNSAAAADLAVSADITGSVAMAKAGKGTLVLSGNNVGATGGMSIEEGVVRFESMAAINGTARDVTVTTPGVVAFGPSFGAGNIPTTMLNRIVASSDGIIAVDGYEATNFDFDVAGLTGAYLGALGDVTYSGTVTPNGSTYRLGGGGGTLTLNTGNALTGSGKSLSVGGKLALTASNDYDGGTTLPGGSVFPASPVVLTLGNNGSLGSGPLTFAGGTIQSADSSARTLANTVVLNASVTILGTGDFNFTNTTPIDLTATRVFFMKNTTNTIAAPLTGVGRILLDYTSTGTLVLQGDNTYAGNTLVNGGTLVVTGDNSAATGGTTLQSRFGATAGLVIGNDLGVGGTLTLTTAPITIAAQGTRDAPNSIAANADFSIVGTDALTLSGTMTLNNNRIITNNNTTSTTTFGNITATNRSLTLNGDGNTIVSGTITTGTGPLFKNGTGTLTFQGANTYSGATNVNFGKLIVNGSTYDATGATVLVNAGTTLGGTGTIGSNTIINNTATLEFDLITAAASHDKLEVFGVTPRQLVFAAASTLTIKSTSGTPGTGTYTLVTANGGISGVVPATVNLPVGWTADPPAIVGNDLVIKINSTGAVTDPFATWALAKGLDGTAGKENGKTDDPDGDGKNNNYEFAFNGDPLDGSDNGMIAGLVQDASLPAGNELTLVVAVRDGVTFAGSGTPVVQSHLTPVDGLTYTIQGTLDLATIPGSDVSHVGGPSDTAPVATGLPDLTGTAWEYHTFKLDASESLGSKGFLRAKVE